MKIFLKFFIFLINQEANGYSCLLQCQGQKTENRVRENDRIFMVSWNDFQILFQKACLPAHMGRDAATCQRMRCCYDQGIHSKYLNEFHSM